MAESFDEVICKFPIFTGFTRHGAQELLAQGEVMQLAPGQPLFKEGDDPAFVLLVLTGRLQVFVERQGRDLVLADSVPGTIVGELAVLCGIPRSASVRASEPCAVLKWSAQSFRRLLLGNVFLSQRVFGEALRTLIDKERSLIDSL